MIDVPALWERTELVSGSPGRGPLGQVHVAGTAFLVLLLLFFRVVVEVIDVWPVIGEGASPIRRRRCRCCRPSVAGGDVNLVEEPLVDGEQRGLQFVLGVLLGGRFALAQLVVLVVEGTVVLVSSSSAATQVVSVVLRWLVADQFHLRSLEGTWLNSWIGILRRRCVSNGT